MTVRRTELIISGVVGLLTGALLTAAAAFLHYLWLPTFLEQPIVAWILFIFFFLLTCIEIPLMIYGFRKILKSENQAATKIVLISNSVFVMFPAIYASPNLLLARLDLIWLGMIIASVGFIRCAASLIFLPGPVGPT